MKTLVFPGGPAIVQATANTHVYGGVNGNGPAVTEIGGGGAGATRSRWFFAT